MTADEIKTLTASTSFYDRYNKDGNWDFLAVLAGRPMQSAEFNEIQHIAEEKVKALGNSLYADVTIIEGCAQRRLILTEDACFWTASSMKSMRLH